MPNRPHETCPSLCVERSHPGREHDETTDGCYCWELCAMGPTCPGANAGLPRGCHRALRAVDPASPLREAAEWLVGIGYPIDLSFTPRAPEALWQAVVDVIHEDDDGTMHGNELSREEVAAWLVDP